MPENPKAESPSMHNTLAPGSCFLVVKELMLLMLEEKEMMTIVRAIWRKALGHIS